MPSLAEVHSKDAKQARRVWLCRYLMHLHPTSGEFGLCIQSAYEGLASKAQGLSGPKGPSCNCDLTFFCLQRVDYASCLMMLLTDVQL